MSIEPRELRNALGQFATGVCLITTMAEDRTPLAITANSFSSVSLEPPLVLWSLQSNSDVYHHFCKPRYFGINVLTCEQQPLSARYAAKGQHEIEPAHYRSGKYGAPIIRDALLSLECGLEATYEGGDHLIIVGRICDMYRKPTGLPLVFYGGGYRELH